MITLRNVAAYAASFIILFCVAVAPDAPLGLRFVPDAQAIVGAPLSPVSVAGVARRTTRRVVVGTEAAEASSAQAASAQQQAATAQQQSATAAQQSATAAQQSATAQQQAAAASGALPLGSVVPKLPTGCSTMSSGGVEYYKCGPDYYRTAFQGNNLVYVTAKP